MESVLGRFRENLPFLFYSFFGTLIAIGKSIGWDAHGLV